MAIADTFRQRLADGDVVVIDGGMGTELSRRGIEMPTTAWAAPAVLDHKDTVREVHEEYIRAGADVIITNTFMGSHQSLEFAGLGDRIADVSRLSAEAALEARDNVADRPVLVAGAIFPGRVADDFEGMRFPTPEDDVEYLTRCVREQATTLVEAGVDVIAFEMIPTTLWGQLAVEVVAELGVPIWLGTTYGKDDEDELSFVFPLDPPGKIGEQVRQIVANTDADIMAVTIMHTEMDYIDEALDDLEPAWQGAIGVYPHHCEHITESPGIRPLPITNDDFAASARGWVDRGVQIIGGCCAIGPEHIRGLKEQLPERVPGTTRR